MTKRAVRSASTPSFVNISNVDPNIVTQCNKNPQCISDVVLSGKAAIGLASAASVSAVQSATELASNKKLFKLKALFIH
jgi:hypothetical protein